MNKRKKYEYKTSVTNPVQIYPEDEEYIKHIAKQTFIDKIIKNTIIKLRDDLKYEKHIQKNYSYYDYHSSDLVFKIQRLSRHAYI